MIRPAPGEQVAFGVAAASDEADVGGAGEAGASLAGALASAPDASAALAGADGVAASEDGAEVDAEDVVPRAQPAATRHSVATAKKPRLFMCRKRFAGAMLAPPRERLHVLRTARLYDGGMILKYILMAAAFSTVITVAAPVLASDYQLDGQLPMYPNGKLDPKEASLTPAAIAHGVPLVQLTPDSVSTVDAWYKSHLPKACGRQEASGGVKFACPGRIDHGVRARREDANRVRTAVVEAAVRRISIPQRTQCSSG